MATVQDYLSNEKWNKRLDQAFVQCDVDKSGYLSREDYLNPMKKVKEAMPDRTEYVDKALKITEEWLDALGMHAGVKVDKQKYKELAAAFSITEAERLKKGELTYVEKMDHAGFDIYDRNNNGYLSPEEYKAMLKIGVPNITDEDVKAAFDLIDTDKNGRLDKKEFAAADVKFWCTLDDSKSDGLFGSKF